MQKSICRNNDNKFVAFIVDSQMRNNIKTIIQIFKISREKHGSNNEKQ